jgi:hypothetical protein
MCAAIAVFTADPDRERGADNAHSRRDRGRKKHVRSRSVKRLDVLRRLALTEDGRRAAIGTLASADVLLIWLNTEHGATARDRLTHRTAAAELRARGLLGAGRPGPQPFPGTDRRLTGLTPLGTVMSRLHRGRTRLRQKLAAYSPPVE